MHDTFRHVALPVLALAACGENAGLPDPRTPTDSVPPAVTDLRPAPGDTGVPQLATIEATFSEPLNWATLGPASFFVTRQQNAVPGSYAVQGVTAVFRPDSALDSLTVYDVTLTSAARDSAGNRLAADTTWSFRTGAPPPPADRRAGSCDVRTCGPR